MMKQRRRKLAALPHPPDRGTPHCNRTSSNMHITHPTLHSPYSSGISSNLPPNASQTPLTRPAPSVSPLTNSLQPIVTCAACLECRTTASSCHMHALIITRRSNRLLMLALSASMACCSLSTSASHPGFMPDVGCLRVSVLRVLVSIRLRRVSTLSFDKPVCQS